ncbi:Hypothetical protein, putative [Bodo saltans]|uniref:Uncharacterized protein n=1 Tax=Bodo saltans TaxID=75058 RepID=A0A0S4JVX7_BODSA|nr:Hypothetical protein, putative [Bodo saltans]|eukprot:CUG94387.1 Hypothetical protein, putative [Bodo saltans]
MRRQNAPYSPLRPTTFEGTLQVTTLPPSKSDPLHRATPKYRVFTGQWHNSTDRHRVLTFLRIVIKDDKVARVTKVYSKAPTQSQRQHSGCFHVDCTTEEASLRLLQLHRVFISAKNRISVYDPRKLLSPDERLISFEPSEVD